MVNKKQITFIYAFRDRDTRRVQMSLWSLQEQEEQNFNVIFVDYGSKVEIAKNIKKTVGEFGFAEYHYIGHSGLLWNKSKALNYGIQLTKTPYIFIADVDLLFENNFSQKLESLSNPRKGFLFHLSYISKRVSQQLQIPFKVSDIEINHTGKINGMLLAPTKTLIEVKGLDEFYHFYGSEDVDLFERLKHSGLVLETEKDYFVKHIWHPIYNEIDDTVISEVPRLFNIKRINQAHYFQTKSQKRIIPLKQEHWVKFIKEIDFELLRHPGVRIQLSTLHHEIVHFFNESINAYNNEVISIVVEKKQFQNNFKLRLKKFLGSDNIEKLSLKAINDIILSKIVFKYRHHNYSYTVNEKEKTINFTIQL